MSRPFTRCSKRSRACGASTTVVGVGPQVDPRGRRSSVLAMFLPRGFGGHVEYRQLAAWQATSRRQQPAISNVQSKRRRKHSHVDGCGLGKHGSLVQHREPLLDGQIEGQVGESLGPYWQTSAQSTDGWQCRLLRPSLFHWQGPGGGGSSSSSSIRSSSSSSGRV